jgi:hypothetical protein
MGSRKESEPQIKGAARHMEEVQQHEMVIEALDLIWGAFRERLLEARLVETDVEVLE